MGALCTIRMFSRTLGDSNREPVLVIQMSGRRTDRGRVSHHRAEALVVGVLAVVHHVDERRGRLRRQRAHHGAPAQLLALLVVRVLKQFEHPEGLEPGAARLDQPAGAVRVADVEQEIRVDLRHAERPVVRIVLVHAVVEERVRVHVPAAPCSHRPPPEPHVTTRIHTQSAQTVPRAASDANGVGSHRSTPVRWSCPCSGLRTASSCVRELPRKSACGAFVVGPQL